MGSNQSINKMINFEDLQAMLSSRSKFLLVNTLSIMEQSCLIQDTLNAGQEESTINNFLENNQLIDLLF